MLLNVLGNPVGLFLDSNGAPLQGGSIYIGQPNTDPTNPVNWITVYQDQALTIPLQQPIKTTNGQPSLNGQQIPVYLGVNTTTYALAALNAGGVVVMSQPSVAPFSLGGSASGGMTVKEFVSGTDFTGGTTTQLSLAANFGSGANVWVDFDGVPQHYPDDYSLSGVVLTFTSPIPQNVQKVYTRAGTTVPAPVPGTGTIIDAMVAAGANINASKLAYTQAGSSTLRNLLARLQEIVSVKDFGAKGDGTTDDTTAIQAAINSLQLTGGLVFFPVGNYVISSTLALKQGVSLIGSGSGRVYDDTSDIYVTTITWNGTTGGTMVDAGNLWYGTLEHIHFDGAFKASNILQLRGSQHSTYRDLLIRRTNNTISGFGISLDMTGQTDNQYPTQFPSCSSNMFDNVDVMDMQYRAVFLNGVITGGVNVSQITENVFIGCQLQSNCVDGGAVVAFNQCCDTNTFYGGMIQCNSVTTGTALVLNFSTVDNGVFGNNFYGTAFNGPPSGFGIDCRNSAGHNSFFGCYMSALGTPVVTNMVNGKPGLVKLYGPNWGGASNVGYLVPSQPVYGVSPWTYTNANPYQIEFQMWGGTVSAVSIGRNGSNSPIGGITANLMSFILEPGDSITITASVAPTMQIIPH